MNMTKLPNISEISPNLGDLGKAGKANKGDAAEFKEALKNQLQTKVEDGQLKTRSGLLQFSNHAVERMQKRGITFTPEQINKIETAVEKANLKGAKETLVLSEDAALIVNLKDNKVVTVMDREMLKENVFTNIDSTVFV